MTLPDYGTIPFAIRDGWPAQLPGADVLAQEAGILLGSLIVPDDQWAALSTSPVYTIRLDDHPKIDGWTSRSPAGVEMLTEFTIPTSPVVVPLTALTHGREFSEWVENVHGASGRLLIWDETTAWWAVNEPGLEVTLICAEPDRLHTWDFLERVDSPSSMPFDWLPFPLGPEGLALKRYLVDRFHLQ